MISVYFIRNGKERIKVDVEPGFTLMDAAVMANIPEIPAICGGNQACGTCHVHVKSLDKVEPAEYNSLETQLLEYEKDYDRMTSRLSCQIELKEKHNWLEVRLRDNELL